MSPFSLYWVSSCIHPYTLFATTLASKKTAIPTSMVIVIPLIPFTRSQLATSPADVGIFAFPLGLSILIFVLFSDCS